MESILEKRYAIMCQRHMSPEDWEAKNPILRSGEMGVEDGTQKFKFGDGVTPWNSLKYSAGGVTVMCLADEWPADYILQEGQIGVEEDTGLCKYGDGETVWDELPYAKAYAYGLNIGNSDSAGGVQQIQNQDGTIDLGYFNFQDKNIDALAEANILSNTVTGRHKENIDKFITWCGANGVAVYGAVGDYSAAFGGKCSAVGKRSLAEGTTVIAVGDYSHVEGNNCVTLGHNAHAEGRQTTASGECAHSEGDDTVARGSMSHAEGWYTKAYGYCSHAQGRSSEANGQFAHAEGYCTYANADCSHAEGVSTYAYGYASHAQGDLSAAHAYAAHAEGWGTNAGQKNAVTGCAAHAEGRSTTALGDWSHAEGYLTRACKEASHAGGQESVADGAFSFAHGYNTKSMNNYETAFGKYNCTGWVDYNGWGGANNQQVPSTSPILFSIGNGNGSARRNAFTILESGTILMDVGGGNYYINLTRMIQRLGSSYWDDCKVQFTDIN